MARDKSVRSVFMNGILTENPTFRLVLGTCPTLAVTTSAMNALGMGAAVIFVLIGSNTVISLLRNFIPEKVRIPSFVIIISTFVTMIELLMHAFVPALYESLGIFIPLIVVNCIIFARAEAFAQKNGVLNSAVDGLAMGLGFTGAVFLIGSVRELISAGQILGHTVMPASFEPMLMIAMASGGFIMFGLALAVFNLIVNAIENRRIRKGGAWHE